MNTPTKKLIGRIPTRTGENPTQVSDSRQSLPEPQASPASTARRSRIWRGIAAFLVTTVLGVTGLHALARSGGADVAHLDQASPLAQLALYGAAFVPAVAMLAAWAASGIGPDWGFRRSPWRAVAVAWLVPTLAMVLAYVPAWLLGLATYDSDELRSATGGLPVLMGVGLAMVPGLLPWMLLAAGEQLGWSSWFVVRSAEIVDRRVVALAVGIGWGAAHVPLMLLVPGAVPAAVPTWFAISMFLIETVALAHPLVWLRLDSRSIWPVLVLHAGVNASIYLVGDLLTEPREATSWFLGEGALLTAVSCAVAVLLTSPWWGGSRRRTVAAARPPALAAMS